MKSIKETIKKTRGSKAGVKLTPKEVLYQIGCVLLASFLFAVSLDVFLLPKNIVIGGVTGISTILNILFHTPVGLMIILINVPLVIVNSFLFGPRFMIKTIIGIASSSVAVDLFSFLPQLTDDILLCALFGGLCMGTALGLFFSKGYTTGGSDLISCLLKLKFPRLSNATMILITDSLIVLVSCFVTRSYVSGLYSVVAIFVSSLFIDLVINGASRAKLALIISDKPQEISAALQEKLQRGTTLLVAQGGYTHKDKQVVMCVVKKMQIYELKTVINSIAPDAFIIFSDAAEVRGMGFESDSI